MSFRTMWDNPVGGVPFKFDEASDAAAAAATEKAATDAAAAAEAGKMKELPAFEELRNFFPDDLKVDKSLDSYKGKEGTANFVKTFISAQKMAGVALKLPAEGASDEERTATLRDVYTKLGCPEKPEYTVNIDEKHKSGGVFSEDVQRTFFAKAHELGLNTTQVQALTDWQVGELEQAIEKEKVVHAKAVADLKIKWGAKDQANIEIANRAFKAMATPKIEQLAKGIGLLDHPEFVEFMFNIGTKLAESNVIVGAIEGATTKEEAASKIAEIMADPKAPYKDHRNPKHKDQQLEMERLHRIVHGDALHPMG